MNGLESAWPDPDRRDAALERLGATVKHAHELWPSRVAYGGERTRTDLDRQELEVLRAASVGLQAAEAAQLLGLSIDTVKERLRGARRHLAAKNTTHAVAEAFRHGFLT